MAGYFQNQYGTIEINADSVIWAGVLPEVVSCDSFTLVSGIPRESIPELLRRRFQIGREDVVVKFSEEGSVGLEIALKAKFGVPIRPAATKLQENIERSVAAVTGLVVDSVDIRVDRIYHESEGQAEVQVDTESQASSPEAQQPKEKDGQKEK
jgi:uncharacterized alkaline shock family protein YloU